MRIQLSALFPWRPAVMFGVLFFLVFGIGLLGLHEEVSRWSLQGTLRFALAAFVTFAVLGTVAAHATTINPDDYSMLLVGPALGCAVALVFILTHVLGPVFNYACMPVFIFWLATGFGALLLERKPETAKETAS